MKISNEYINDFINTIYGYIVYGRPLKRIEVTKIFKTIFEINDEEIFTDVLSVLFSLQCDNLFKLRIVCDSFIECMDRKRLNTIFSVIQDSLVSTKRFDIVNKQFLDSAIFYKLTKDPEIFEEYKKEIFNIALTLGEEIYHVEDN